MRLNQFIAHAAGLSRRQADQAVAQGDVRVNGQLARIGQAVEDSDKITLNGELLAIGDYSYVLFNKPEGYVCSRRNQGEAQTIYELIPKKYHHLKPVGRLDRDSSGLLLLTDDGQLAQELTHPKYHKQKTYKVELDKSLSADHQAAIEHGVDLEDGRSTLKLEGKGKHWQVLMHEGRNRQIRRTFAALGYTVTKLHRTHFGSYELGNLVVGETLKTDKP